MKLISTWHTTSGWGKDKGLLNAGASNNILIAGASRLKEASMKPFSAWFKSPQKPTYTTHQNITGCRSGIGSQSKYPGYGSCLRCQTSWGQVEEHSTMYSDTWGCFPLCEGCWQELTPKDRLPFYKVLWERNKFQLELYKPEGEPSDWTAIEKAVLEGK